MEIDGTIYNGDLMDILVELQTQLRINHIDLLKDIKDGEQNIQVTCPFHANGQERHPSFGIHKVTGVGHCFTCHTSVILPEFISYCFGYRDYGIFGKQWLNKNFAAISVENRKVVDFDVRSNNVSNNLCPTFVSEEELDSYRYYHPYMYKRKLTNEIIEKFDIGYDSSSSCITFPIRDIKGNTLYIARRSVNTKWFNYPASSEKPVYGLYELSQIKPFPKEVIICESMLDALHFWVVGKYACALNGLGTQLQFKQLRAMPCRKFILCTDMDDAGMKARGRIKKELTNKLISEYMLPEGRKDANDCTEDELLNLKEVF